MSARFENLKTPAIVSAVLVSPFMILEMVNRRNLNAGFPRVLFGLMWLLAMSFMIILMPLLRRLPGGSRNIPKPVSILPRVIPLILIAGMWLALVLDQMPCFLGVPNCD